MRIWLRAVGAALLVGLAACAPPLPDSAAGVGFSSEPPPTESSILASPLPPSGAVSDENRPLETTSTFGAPATVSTGQPLSATASDPNADLAAETAAALAAANANSGVPPVQASPQNPAPAIQNNPGISDENDFAAVSSRRSIESDAARIEANRGQFQTVAPATIPQRPADNDPNVVAYALSSQHPRGTRVYSRSGVNLATKAQRACARYASPDQAQMDFLAKGGPQRDRLGLDPDGDGYACAWDPSPFRAATRN